MPSQSEVILPRVDTLAVLADLANAEQRQETARVLARHFGADDLLFFIQDPEVGVLLPAAGMRQTLPEGRRWHQFLKECSPAAPLHGELPYPSSDSMVPATGLGSRDGSVLVFLGRHLPQPELSQIQMLMPVLAAAFHGERAATTAATQAALAQKNTETANALAATLDSARRELQQLLYEAEINQQQRAFLADASAKLSASLEFGATLDQVVQLVVPHLADYCSIELLQEDGSIEHVAAAASDSERGERIREIREQHPIDSEDDHPIANVVRSGQTLVLPEIDEQLIRSIATSPKHREAILALRITSAMCVPMTARDRILGVLLFISAESGRRFGPREQELAEDLAGRAALAIENARLYRTAQAAGQAREEFLSIASHELKTPLTTVKGYIQILMRHLQDPSRNQDRLLKTVHSLSGQSERIEALVSDLLEASRIRQGRVELRLEQLDLRQMAQRVISHFEEAPEHTGTHQLILDAPEPIQGYWDAFRLEQVLSNLVSNALKYSPSGGEVRVTVGCDNHEAVIAVHDQGVGISPEGRARLFEPFYRNPEISASIGGTGLGLFIAQQIVERHNGSIDVNSRPGHGSTFTVRLPLNTS